MSKLHPLQQVEMAAQARVASFRAMSDDEIRAAIDVARVVRHPAHDLLALVLEEVLCLRGALLAHRADLHQGSSRPCPTCRQSAAALGLTGRVHDCCANLPGHPKDHESLPIDACDLCQNQPPTDKCRAWKNGRCQNFYHGHPLEEGGA